MNDRPHRSRPAQEEARDESPARVRLPPPPRTQATMPRALRSAAKLQKAVVPPPAAAEEARRDPSLVLSPDVLGLVLKRLSLQDLAKLPRVACLSRSWADAVAEVFDDGAVAAGVTPVELRKLKTIARESPSAGLWNPLAPGVIVRTS
jgi:hypothetical protein